MHDELEKTDIAFQQVVIGNMTIRYEFALVLSDKVGIRLQLTPERPQSPRSPSASGRLGGLFRMLDHGEKPL